MGFRISFGSASCKDFDGRSLTAQKACELVLANLERLKQLTPDQLKGVPACYVENFRESSRTITLTTYKEVLRTGEILFVSQGFYSTFWCPTFFSTSGIGRIFVEGLVLTNAGTFRDPHDEELWNYK